MQNSTDTDLNTAHRSRKTRGFKDVIAWQRGMQLTLAVYKLTARFPVDELYGLSSQMRRAATSIPSNVAEGYGRGSTAQYKQGVLVARGSCAELETQLMIAKRLRFAPSESFDRVQHLCEETSKILHSLVLALGRKAKSGDAH